MYRISVSPSGRGHCRRCRSVIAKGETRLEVCAFVRPGRYTLLLRYMGQGGWDGGVGSGGARGRRGARAAAPGPRAAAACDVPPVARGDARGDAVVGRRVGRRGTVPRPVWGVRERGARRRVCALSVRSAARRRGGGAAVCGPRVLPPVVAGYGGEGLGERCFFCGGWWGDRARGIWLWTCERVCVVCCAFLCVCASPLWRASGGGCAYSFVHYHPHDPIPSGGPPEGMYTRSFITTPFSSCRGPPEGRFAPRPPRAQSD